MYTWSTSGRSSRSTLMHTKWAFMKSAASASENVSCSITWHQWHALYPTLTSTSLRSARALAQASGPYGSHRTGLCMC